MQSVRELSACVFPAKCSSILALDTAGFRAVLFQQEFKQLHTDKGGNNTKHDCVTKTCPKRFGVHRIWFQSHCMELCLSPCPFAFTCLFPDFRIFQGPTLKCSFVHDNSLCLLLVLLFFVSDLSSVPSFYRWWLHYC